MYPFTSNNNNDNLSFTSTYNIHPFSFSSLQFNSPHNIAIDDGTIFNEVLRQDNLLSYAHNNNNNNSNKNNNKPESSTTKKRVSKKDRHSKIITAQGPRDRRMRLSLEVAKKFFKLQDILGFDKASETVNWLLMSSKFDIQQLLINSHHRSSFSVVSNINASSASKCDLMTNNIDDEKKEKASTSCSSNLKEKKRASRGVRKSSYLLRPLAKETREMARKRARDRTMEKTSKLRPCLDLEMNQDVNRCNGSWIINQSENISSNFQFKQGYIGDNSSSSMTDDWNPDFLINYQPNGGVLFHENQLNY